MCAHMSETARAFAPSTTAEELDSLSGGKGPGRRDAAPADAVPRGPSPPSPQAYVEIPLEGSDDGHRTTTVDDDEVGAAPTMRVPVRRIELTDDTTFDVYDTSGPYTGYPD